MNLNPTSFNTIIIVCLILYVGMLTFIGVRETKKAHESFESYAIANKSLPSIVVALTVLATALGASDMIAHADSSYVAGIAWLAWPAGENIAKIIFALVAGKFIANLNLKTIADFVECYIVNDRVTKLIVGLITSLPGIAWVGAQSMAIGSLFSMFTGLNSTPIIIISTIVFITYTAAGGINAVAKTDSIQSSVILICATGFYLTIFRQFNFNLGALKEMAIQIDPGLWSFSSLSAGRILTLIATPLLGTCVAQYYWQRLYAAKNPRSAKNMFVLMAVVAFLICTCTVFSGIYARVINPGISGSGAMTFLVSTLLPQWLQLAFIVAIVAATLSSADSLLNSAAITIVNDCIMPFKKLTDKQAIKFVTIATVLIGLTSLTLSLSFDFILKMIELVYGGVGGTLVPFLIIGLFWKKDKSKEFNVNNSRLTSSAAHIGLISGLVTGIVFSRVPSLAAIMGGGIFPAIIVSSLCYILISLFTQKETSNYTVSNEEC